MEDSGHRIARLAAEAVEAASPREALRAARELRREVDAFERRQAAIALAEGSTFAEIARDIGVSRQAVHRRFRELVESEARPVMSAEVRRILREARGDAVALGARSLASEQSSLMAAPAAEARRRGAQRVEVEDLLIGILSDETAGAARILRALGVDLAIVRTEIATLRNGRRSAGSPRSA
jgi:DNA-binding Lrp family transcriptional regulator